MQFVILMVLLIATILTFFLLDISGIALLAQYTEEKGFCQQYYRYARSSTGLQRYI